MKSNSFQKISIFCIAIDILIIIAIFLLRKNLPPIIPLFYGMPISESQLAGSLSLAIPPFISGVFVALNFGLNSLFKDSFLQQILSGLTIALTALSAVAVVKIILLVI